MALVKLFLGTTLTVLLSLSLVSSLISSQAHAEAFQRSLDLARKLYFRLTGNALVNPVLRKSIADLVEAGKFEEAAAAATLAPGFINNTIRQFSATVHNRNQSSRENGLTESMLYFMLVARENRPFDDVLKGRDYPMINIAAGRPCADRQGLDRLACLDDQRIDLSSAEILTNSTQNRVVASNVPAAESAGIFTMQGFGSAAYEMGSNRRALQQTFNQLWCLSNENMKSEVADIGYIARDVARTSDGDQGPDGAFEKECRKCHSVLDGLRGAFAFLDAEGGKALTYSANGMPVAKYERGREEYPDGFATRDDTWQVTFDRDPSMILKLGWPTFIGGGKGVSSFGAAVAQTERFYTCMVEKVIDTVCPQDPNARERGRNYILDPNKVVPKLSADFKKEKNLRNLFHKVAARPECLGR